MFKQNVRMIVDAIPAGALVFMIGANERFRWPGEPKAVVLPTQAAVNRWCRDMAAKSQSGCVLLSRRNSFVTRATFPSANQITSGERFTQDLRDYRQRERRPGAFGDLGPLDTHFKAR